ncbi:MAG: hypothetical protein EPN93_01970 [Spirochaetes bacterium]|nr:MAG: hypothetical protein EPN93_01970 [Spirochaetota bacterium]
MEKAPALILMAKISMLLLAAACLGALFSCELTTRPPSVEWVRPSEGVYASPADFVEIRFSENMERESVERLFGLACEGAETEGSFSWPQGARLLRFSPHKEMERGMCIVTLAAGARDRQGSETRRAYTSRFFTSNDLAAPVVAEVFPSDSIAGVRPDTRIRIRFSEPMDARSVERGLRMYPSAEGAFSWNEAGDTVEFAPFLTLAFLTEYTVSIGAECADRAGNRIGAQRDFRFRAGEEFVRPVLVETTSPSTAENWVSAGMYSEHHGLETDSVLELAFSERMDRSSLTEGFALTPAAAAVMTWESDTRAVIRFPAGLENETRYEMRITESVKDAAGNPLESAFTAYFHTDGEDSRAPAVSAASIAHDGGPTGLIHMGLALPDGNILVDSTAVFDLVFCTDMRRASVPENVSIVYVNGADPNFSGAIRRYEWSGRTLRLTVGSLRRDNLYELRLRGGADGITSATGATRSGDIRYFFRFGE